MKRPVPFVLLATLLFSVPALAANGGSEFKEKLTGKIARAERTEQRGNDRGGNHRGSDSHRGSSHGNNDRRRDHGNGPGSNGTRPGGDVSVHRDYRGYHDRNNRDNDHRNDRGNDHRRDDRHDGRHGNNDRHWSTRGHGNDWSRYRSDWNRHPHYWDNRRHDRHDYARYRYHYGHYHRPHGYYHRVWYRGNYLPHGWYGSSYIIHDWHPYRLYAPPYGYAWVRVGNDVLLTALATGLVLDVIYDIWY